MRRKCVLLVLCVMSFQLLHAQTWDEWFRQRKTQKKYLLQQIAALKVYINYARDGYKIASDGLNIIRKIKDGDFKLHEEFFASFRYVNPRIKNYTKVAASIALQSRIIKETSKALRAMRASGEFTPTEISYSTEVIERLLSGCLDTVNELFLVVTDGELELKDDERINHIDKLYADMQDKYSFCTSFNEEIGILAMQRQAEKIEVNYSKILNRIP